VDSGDIWPHLWMCRLSFINVVCEILKSICDLYKFMLSLSHGKAKEKKKKEKNKGSSPSATRAFGTRGTLNFFKKVRGLPRVPGHLALGETWAFDTQGRPF
jgi:hypothetical protein